jgi:hypothetical protein
VKTPPFISELDKVAGVLDHVTALSPLPKDPIPSDPVVGLVGLDLLVLVYLNS